MLSPDAVLLKLIPDPCQVWSGAVGVRKRPHERSASQRLRRAQIFAETRRLITQSAPQNVQIQEVAAVAGVAIQTIYNLIGNRNELLLGAVEEWGCHVAEAARESARVNAWNPTYCAFGMFWAAAFEYSKYVVGAAWVTNQTWEHRRRVYVFGAQQILPDLQLLHAKGEIRSGVDRVSLAHQLSLVANSSLCEWITHPYDERNFQRALVNGPGLMLSAALQGKALDALERTMAELKVLPRRPG
ncbi:MAG: TetR/AcrR family transcriptional regulator [Steroidobacteraceae bacterium]